MRLDQELVLRKLSESRTEAQELISSGSVFVNSILCTKQTKQITAQDILLVTLRRQFVSRGGEKLQGIVRDIYGDDESLKKKFYGKNALDIGSSTGGFTDCLLYYGVAHVDAVDVGKDQLHEKIRNNKQVSVYENTDIRNFKKRDTEIQKENDILQKNNYDILVADLSFISLKQVIDDIVRLGSCGSLCFLLIKPQFEVGRGNTKKGIVKDIVLVETILMDYKKLAEEKGLTLVTILPSRIQGGDGNQEYFLYGILEK